MTVRLLRRAAGLAHGVSCSCVDGRSIRFRAAIAVSVTPRLRHESGALHDHKINIRPIKCLPRLIANLGSKQLVHVVLAVADSGMQFEFITQIRIAASATLFTNYDNCSRRIYTIHESHKLDSCE